jgi:hypothetical protein
MKCRQWALSSSSTLPQIKLKGAAEVDRCKRPGSLAMFAAIRRASSLLSNLAADRRPAHPRNRLGERLAVGVADNEAGSCFFCFPGLGGNLLPGTLSSTPDQSQKKQQDNRADGGVDDCGNDAAADFDANPRQQPASDESADNPNDDVADQPVAPTFYDRAGKPTGDGTNDQPNDECLCVHLSPRFFITKQRPPACDVTG